MLKKLKRLSSDEFPIVIENELVLWDGDLDEALLHLGYEIEETTEPVKHGDSLTFVHLDTRKRGFCTLVLVQDNNEENPYLQFN